VLWIGVVITAQAFQATPRAHASAVALGLFPAVAAWGMLMVSQTLGAAGIALGKFDLAEIVLKDTSAFSRAGLMLEGLVALSQGFMLTCLVWSAASACLIERQFLRAAVWMSVGAVFSFFGFVHAGELTASGGVSHIGWATGWQWSVGYLLSAGFFLLLALWARSGRSGYSQPH
jgi:AGZA family xanthine/uracil permease-like MFS transporter